MEQTVDENRGFPDLCLTPELPLPPRYSQGTLTVTPARHLVLGPWHHRESCSEGGTAGPGKGLVVLGRTGNKGREEETGPRGL